VDLTPDGPVAVVTGARIPLRGAIPPRGARIPPWRADPALRGFPRYGAG